MVNDSFVHCLSAIEPAISMIYDRQPILLSTYKILYLISVIILKQNFVIKIMCLKMLFYRSSYFDWVIGEHWSGYKCWVCCGKDDFDRKWRHQKYFRGKSTSGWREGRCPLRTGTGPRDVQTIQDDCKPNEKKNQCYNSFNYIIIIALLIFDRNEYISGNRPML